MPRLSNPRILFVDAYDSFANNITTVLETELNAHITVIKIDARIVDLPAYINDFHAVVLGPGPGDPRNAADVGLFNQFWNLTGNSLRPTLGICLGFQSLVLYHGGSIQRLPEPRHGQIKEIRHQFQDVFHNMPSLISTVHYHSLYATLPVSLNGDNEKAGRLVPLAYEPNFSPDPPNVLMAVKHTSKPFHGLQFHPESISSSQDARNLIKNWWSKVESWWQDRSHMSDRVLSSTEKLDELAGKPTRSEILNPDILSSSVLSKTILVNRPSIPSIIASLQLESHDYVLLDSENHQRPVVGLYSIIGLVTENSLRIEYCAESRIIREIRGRAVAEIHLDREFGNDIFSYLRSFMSLHRCGGGGDQIPFWGGLIGYISYECGLNIINVTRSVESAIHATRPDLSFVFVERSIVVRHDTGHIYAQSIQANDLPWIEQTVLVLSATSSATPPLTPVMIPKTSVTLPNRLAYMRKVEQAQEHIRAGDSYEICLTTQATISTDHALSAWQLYLRLRQINPAPFAAYLPIGEMTLLSSSPERFLSWTRPTPDQHTGHSVSTCQFRPIKGTVNRRPDLSKPPLTLNEAKIILASPKEMAENLMIVDLIRHDLHGVAGPGNVTVPKLMVVEEYETLFQLVSVIEGKLHDSDSADDSRRGDIVGENHNTTRRHRRRTGLDVLAASLPPGSMTGAPKIRSCQLLQALEQKPRGIYSGVAGYLDVGGSGDFSVVIRSAVNWKEDGKEHETKQDRSSTLPHGSTREKSPKKWTIGAGGAVTAMSTAEGEYEEMMTKLRSTLRLFDGEDTVYIEGASV